MNKSLSIAIAGAGTAGLASALLLARSGHHVTLFEQHSTPKAVGAGILLQPSGQWVMKKLGLLDELAAQSSIVNRLYGDTPKSRTILDLKYQDAGSEHFGLGVHRGNLFNTLYQAALKEPNINLVTGYQISSFVQTGKNKVTIRGDANHASNSFDLFVIANGMRSSLRSQLNIKFTARQYPWGALWGITEQLDDTNRHTLAQRYAGCKYLLGMLPTGCHHLNPDKPLNSFFWSLPVSQQHQWHVWGIDRWQDEVTGIWPEITATISTLNSPSKLKFAEYFDVKMPYWHKENTVIIGDAAHGTSPQLGQGANLALVDAWVLVQTINKTSNVHSALQDYSIARQKHLKYYQTASRWLTPFFQSNSTTVGWMRDIGMPLTNNWPVIKPNMLNTLIGTKTGIFSDMDLSDEDPFFT